MPRDNHVTLTGNLTRTPELRYTPNGMAVASFGLAVNHSIRRGDQWENEAHFFDVTCWSDLAENVVASFVSGNRVIVDGRLQFRQWEKDGEKRSKVEVVADEVAASVRWATVEITRTESGGQRDSGGAPEYDPGEEPF